MTFRQRRQMIRFGRFGNLPPLPGGLVSGSLSPRLRTREVSVESEPLIRTQDLFDGRAASSVNAYSPLRPGCLYAGSQVHQEQRAIWSRQRGGLSDCMRLPAKAELATASPA